MAPKKAQKMSLNAFLEDDTLGSWADEMDNLPTAPAPRTDDDRNTRNGDRRRDDFLSSRPDRSGPPREDIPLPSEPPFTAFIGNLAFDITEAELEDCFGGLQTKSVKIIKDRDDKPKGFGYIEFAELDGLKDALTKSGTSLAGRTIRVSVAEPPKERSGFGGGAGFDDEKFAGNWRRDGPLPDLPSVRDSSRRRFDGPGSTREPPPPSVSDNASDWRSSTRVSTRAPPADADAGGSSFKRRSGLRENAPPLGPADTEETWTIGSKFKPSAPSEQGPPTSGRFGRPRGDMGPPKEASSPPDDSDWRRRPVSRSSTSPSNSTPPTPQLSRRKLELLPRSTAASATPSPLSSPNPSAPSSQRSNPFGAAKPVDVSAREALVAERLEKERESTKERVAHSMSRTSSRAASVRERDTPASRTTPPASSSSVASPTASSPAPTSPKLLATTANVRPSFSFANAAAGKKDAVASPSASAADAENTDGKSGVDEITEKLEEVEV